MLTKKIVKYIQSLSHKKLRDEAVAFVAEGPKVVAELLSAPSAHCRMICAEKEWIGQNEYLLGKVPADQVFEIDHHWLERISLLKTPNQVVAVFDKFSSPAKPVLQNKISLMLDDIQDPGNLGTIIRNADWFGIDNIICSRICADCYNPKVVQATMGSLARVNVFYEDLHSFINENLSIPVYGAALSGKSVYELEELKEGIFLFGNESKGIHEEILNLCKARITIPRFGNAESLNAAVAAGIILAQLKKTATKP